MPPVFMHSSTMMHLHMGARERVTAGSLGAAPGNRGESLEPHQERPTEIGGSEGLLRCVVLSC